MFFWAQRTHFRTKIMVPADSGRFIEFRKIDIFRDFREFSKICSFTRPFRTSGEINTKFKSHPRTNKTRFDWITISEIALHTWGAIKYVATHIPHIYGSIIWIAWLCSIWTIFSLKIWIFSISYFVGGFHIHVISSL